MSVSPFLELDGVSLAFRTRTARVQAMNGVSLTVNEGEAVGLVGESGSGKSTLARALLGLNPERSSSIEAGRLLIGGRDVAHLAENEWEQVRGGTVAMVFQDPLSFLNPVMRVGRQLAESIEHHTPRLTIKARVAELLDLVKLPTHVAHAFPHELSGGMRQRALIAIALACKPRLLVADEPTTALDVTTQAEILLLLRDLRRELGMAMLLISHDLGIVASACERIYVMYAGHIVEWGATGNVFSGPAHPYTRGLLQAARAARDAGGHFASIAGDPPNLAKLGQGCPFAPRCPVALPACKEAMPSPTKLAEAGHQARCWLYPSSKDAA
jgi:oligopeptide/dipeptide ABC transporter ATP-binding protein